MAENGHLTNYLKFKNNIFFQFVLPARAIHSTMSSIGYFFHFFFIFFGWKVQCTDLYWTRRIYLACYQRALIPYTSYIYEYIFEWVGRGTDVLSSVNYNCRNIYCCTIYNIFSPLFLGWEFKRHYKKNMTLQTLIFNGFQRTYIMC